MCLGIGYPAERMLVDYRMLEILDTERVKSHRNLEYSEDSVGKLEEEGLLQLMKELEPGRALD